MAATIYYFGRFPTTIVMQSSTQFNGTAQTGTPVMSPGAYTFPVQAGGGLYAFHDLPIEVEQISFSGGSTCTVTKVVEDSNGSTLQSTTLATLNSSNPIYNTKTFLTPNEYLTFSSSGGANPVVAITAHLASYAADGGS